MITDCSSFRTFRIGLLSGAGLGLRLGCLLTIVLACQAPRNSQPPSPGQIEISTPRYSKLPIKELDGKWNISDVVISLSREWGMGFPPCYVITIRGDGTGNYRGIQNVLTKGKRTFSVTSEQVLSLLDLFETAEFMALLSPDKVFSTDIPINTVALKIGSQSHSVRDQRWPAKPFADSERAFRTTVSSLEVAIDRIANAEAWIGTEAERANLFHPQRR